MRSNRGISEFASFPLLLVIALVFIIISLLMFVAEFRSQTAEVDAGLQAALIGLLHAERDQVEAYARTALDRAVRDGAGHAYMYRSVNCPLSEHGVPILTGECGYDTAAFEREVERASSDLFASILDAHPSAVLRDSRVRIEDVSVHGEINNALVFLETGRGSRVAEISSDIDPDRLPVFMGPIRGVDETPPSVGAVPDLDMIDESTEAYCEADPFNEEKAATFVRNVVSSCEARSGTCSCGSVPLIEQGKALSEEEGALAVYGRVVGRVAAVAAGRDVWTLGEGNNAIADVETDRLYIHRDASGVIVNTSDPGLASCSAEDVSDALLASTGPLPNDLSGSSLSLAPNVIDLDFAEISEAQKARIENADLFIFITDHSKDVMAYEGSPELGRLIDIGLRADASIYGLAEEALGNEVISCIAKPYLFDASQDSRFIRTDASEAVRTKVGALSADTDVLHISFPSRTASDCGSQPLTAQQRNALMGALIDAIDEALLVRSNPPRTRIACIDDPIEEWVEHPDSGHQEYLKVYPTVAVPVEQDHVWPLERIGEITQCWGPAVDETRRFYSYHRGIDVQPSGPRLDRGTVMDRFIDYPVVSAFDGTITAYAECPVSIFEPLPTPEGIGTSAERADAIEALCGPDSDLGGGLGEHLVITSTDDRFSAIYAHLAPGSIREVFGIAEAETTTGVRSLLIGRNTDAGQPIGYVGNTGSSTGAHLHFEIYETNNDHISNAGYPSTPAGGWAPPAQRFAQFNPLCSLPRTVIEDGERYDISERFPARDSVDVDIVDLSDASGSGTPADVPEGSNCNFDYWMAYYNYNPLPETYGVCPVDSGALVSDEPDDPSGLVGTPLPAEVSFAYLEGGEAVFLIEVDRSVQRDLTYAVRAELRSASGTVELPVNIADDMLGPQKFGSAFSVELPAEQQDGYVIEFELSFDGYDPSPKVHTVEFEP